MHNRTVTSPSSWRVYQFHHLGNLRRKINKKADTTIFFFDFITILTHDLGCNAFVTNKITLSSVVFFIFVEKKLKRAIVSVINDLSTDRRVDKTCHTLVELGFDVLLVGRITKKSLPLPKRIYRTKRFKLLFEKGPLFYACYNIRLFFFLWFHRADLLFSNDLDTLLPNKIMAKFKKVPLIYDSHEYFTGVPELAERPAVRKIWQWIERKTVPGITDFITVNESIAGLYMTEYKVDPIVVRNISPVMLPDKFKSRLEMGLPENIPLIILQGNGINKDRGSEEAVLAMKYVESGKLLIVGDGDVLPDLKDIVLKNNLQDNIIFIPRQPMNELIHYTHQAYIGLTLDKGNNINYKYSLPNKLFDYIHAGIPVLASPLVEVEKIINHYNIGCCIENHTPEHIGKMINFMLSEKDQYQMWKSNLRTAATELTWENEKIKLIEVLKKYA